MKRRLQISLAMAVLVACVLAVFAYAIGGYCTERDAVARRARIELLWPDILAFAPNERALIQKLAVHCKLATRPFEAAAVVACLHGAAVDPRFPAHGAHAPSELRRLLMRSASSRQPPA